jgi:hypothetical protein
MRQRCQTWKICYIDIDQALHIGLDFILYRPIEAFEGGINASMIAIGGLPSGHCKALD